MPQEKKKQIKTTTGILIILAAAVIIGGGAIAYFYAMSPTSWDYMGNRTSVHKSSNANTNTANTNSTTADWKTYTNSTYGFSFKYPKDFSLSDKLPKTDKDSAPSEVLLLKNSKMEISIWPKPAGWGYEDYSTEISTNEVNVDGVKATERMLSNGSNTAISVLSQVDSNPFFYWAIISKQSDKTDFDTILSTFQFTP
jgi:hypothetical protein